MVFLKNFIIFQYRTTLSVLFYDLLKINKNNAVFSYQQLFNELSITFSRHSFQENTLSLRLRLRSCFISRKRLFFFYHEVLSGLPVCQDPRFFQASPLSYPPTNKKCKCDSNCNK